MIITGLATLAGVTVAQREPEPKRTVTARALPAPGIPDPRFTVSSGPRAGVRGDADAPVLVLTDPAVPFGDAVCDAILPTEGLPACAATDAAALPAGFDLDRYSVVVAADGHALPPSLIKDLTAWVKQGGHLIALRPAENLNELLGLGPRRAVLDDAYLTIDPATPEGTGLETKSLRYHGEADEHLLAGATVVARLNTSQSTATGFPAVTTRTVGQGTAEAWTFDPARSILRSRNGNPDLIGLRTVSSDENVRLADRFGDGYLDVDRAAVPQADELMHLLTHQILSAAAVPRLWYLPSYDPATHPGGLLKAAVVLTGDDHDGDDGTASHTLARFKAERAESPAGCSAAEWTCITSTSYAFPGAFADAAAKPYTDQGFEVSPHIAANGECVNGGNLDAVVQTDLAAWQAAYPSIAAAHPPTTERWHCYGDWTTDGALAGADARAGLTADLSTACWPEKAFDSPQCLLTGSALPMAYADRNGRLSGVTGFTTVTTDENPAGSSRNALAGLITNAIDGHGYYGYLAALAHLDGHPESEKMAADLTDLARQYGLPVVSARQAADFWAGRAATRTEHVRTTAKRLTFDLAKPVHNLELMIPAKNGVRKLTSVRHEGVKINYTTQILDGVSYALLPAATAGAWTANYA